MESATNLTLHKAWLSSIYTKRPRLSTTNHVAKFFRALVYDVKKVMGLWNI